MADFAIEAWNGKNHVRDGFTCGEPSLDDFLHLHLSQYEKRRLGKTFVATKTGERTVLGYYTLASSSIPFANVPPTLAKKLAKHPVPVVLLARLAVDLSVQGQGLGETLLADAMRRVLGLSSNLGIHAIEVTALNVSAQAFYEKYGFVVLADDPFHLFLPLTVMEKVWGEQG